MPAPTSSTSLDLPGKLKWYYARLFPLESVTRWLRYGSDANLTNREISFTLQGDIYLRWKSFSTREALLESLKSLAPIKIDIGAIYDNAPSQRQSVKAALTPMQKEFVLDIDMTDYEDVILDLSGGSATELTDRNWRYMATAVEVLDEALRLDFGFEHILWVYSGRRGIHCWVGDARARVMNNEQRAAVAEYLYIRFEGRENAGRRQNEVTCPAHPALGRARRRCEEVFKAFVLEEQGLLNTDERVCAVTEMLPNKGFGQEVARKLLGMGPGRGGEKWERLEKELVRGGRSDWWLRSAADYVVLRHTYPRLDVNVSKEINHLLKAPFCVHPKTGRVCVPFRAGEAGVFVPGEKAPVLDGLIKEIENGEGEMMKRLREGVAVFDEFVQGVEKEVRAGMRKQRLEEMDRRGVVELVSS